MSQLNSKNIDQNIDRFLEFSLGDENYAIPLLDVREVIAIPNTTPIPYAPAHFVGIMNLRGQVISILDLRKKMNIQEKQDNEEAAVIIVDLNPIFVGVIVDSVNTVLAIGESEVSPAPSLENLKSDYIHGIYRKNDSMTILVDIGKLLDIRDMKVIQEGKVA